MKTSLALPALFGVLTLAACTAYDGTTAGGYDSSSSSEGFVWASSYSSSSVSKPAASTAAVRGPGCKIGGCSAELCVNMDSDNVVSTCIWRNEYACYQTARCEKQSDGECGWTQTAALTACLANPPERS